MIDVFVSYASEDRERVRPLVEMLERGGWEVWWDRQIGAGTAFDREIEKAIDQAKCIVVAWSSHSIESEWVRTEANEGLEKGNLVPVALDEVRPPLAFRRIQTIDFGAATAIEEIREAVGKFSQPAAQDLGDLTPFVGRNQERERAEEILGRVNDKEGRTLLIGGEVGVGKTRLVRELGIAARNKGFIVLYGRCVDMDGATPYHPLLEQIAQATRISTPDNMRRSLGENAPEVAKLMPELRQQFSDIAETPELPPDQERRYLLNGVGDFIDRGARMQPMVLVYEDLHWADDSTCILLRHLAERLKDSPIFIIGTYRDDELDPRKPFANTLRELNRERLADEILLKCFDKDGVRDIIEARARKTAPQELVDLVFTETEGNPFFVEEVFRHLEEVGKLFDAEGNFLSGVEIKDTEVPRGVQLVIGERLGRVSDACRQVLTLAAVAGRTFSFDLLLRAGGKLDEDDILDAIEDADAAGLIEDMSREREARYGFVHEQIRQSLLLGLSLPRRQRVHLRIADALEEIHGNRADEIAGELSYHLYQAGASADVDKTAHYLTQAGKRAMESLAFEDALRRLDSALEIVSGDAARQADTLRLKATAECGMGQIDDSLQSLDAAAELAPEQRDDIILQRCRMLLDVWRGSEAVEDLEQLLARKQTSDDREGELEAQRWMARAYYVMSLDRQGYSDKVKDAYSRTIELAKELGNDKTRAHALIATAQLVDYDRSFFPTAQKNLEEAENLGEQLDDDEIRIDAATARLNAVFSDDTDQLGEDLLKTLLVRRDPIRLNAHYFRMMWSTYAAARLERCVEICDAGTELAYRIGTLPVQYATIKAMALLDLGRFDDALAALDEEIADEEHRFGAALQKLGELQYLLDCGHFEEAFEKTPHIVSEAKVLSRMWMLSWVANSLANSARYLMDEADMMDQLEGLLASTETSPGRMARCALALARKEFETAREISDQIAGRLEASARDMGPYLTFMDVRSFILAADNRWQDVLVELDTILPRCRESNVNELLWRALAMKSRAEHMVGNDEAAEACLKESKEIHSAIASRIANPAHRAAFETGRVAKVLGVA